MSLGDLVNRLRAFCYRRLSTNRKAVLTAANAVQPVVCTGEGRIVLDESARIGWRESFGFYSGYSYLEARSPAASVSIGAGTIVNNNCAIVANSTSIDIGRNCRIGVGFTCLDSDFHGLHPLDRDNLKALVDKPVVLEDDVFIGENVTVLKGVTIGKGSVIGSGSMVVASVPPMSIAAGNPCRVIRAITDADRIA